MPQLDHCGIGEEGELKFVKFDLKHSKFRGCIGLLVAPIMARPHASQCLGPEQQLRLT